MDNNIQTHIVDEPKNRYEFFGGMTSGYYKIEEAGEIDSELRVHFHGTIKGVRDVHGLNPIDDLSDEELALLVRGLSDDNLTTLLYAKNIPTAILEKIKGMSNKGSYIAKVQSGNITYSNGPYKILGVHDKASTKECKLAYHNKVKEFHPDRAKNEAERILFESKIKEINAAWDIIKIERNLI